MSISKITTCLWFDNQAEEAANHYVSTFGGDSKITTTQRYSSAGEDTHGRQPGSVMVVEFELRGNRFVGLNGGPAKWSFNEAISFQVECEDQAEVDHFWEKLGEGGDESRRQCGWIADKYGVAWQVVPKALKRMLSSDDKAAAGRATVEMMKMKKLDIGLLEKAFKG
ncbi:3-demethylubiquinone-9 3-methyltransferase-domain-containing protein [Ilyonectria robusta]|uniref:3-demethylubiquinone-9 3-methyltransferase-domain-containing protein n=1 Tax=Ilyonectria robusta TaxID=1079257 RepID=UPI001E8D2B70|nr:3-demethylubiquinone-9 3-methyltransferase-domain-containing protein [Ilyonectria robusta]KAH6986224.1 3-demethylubiquinone-9 3-methyltransferase-domain-containing protein [Ilyonectria sp. MPI-CAGE-AT-0026]KAH7011414.1 3-demethylubiquinone-9 3-methyltransferase-domain-containing protein [Ilyonectria destructans]KAH8672997.1 3-demethylubiquinone-9 3-methyltransferase-domain-containing protein [Ilyonectria robusta]